jgi:hypothetical protein
MNRLFICFGTVITLLTACNKISQPSQPEIHSITPASGGIGLTITITGNHFGTDTAGVLIYFGDKTTSPITLSDTVLTVQIPKFTSLGVITVVVHGVASNQGGIDLLSGSWTKNANLPVSGGRARGGGFAINGKGYFVGGIDQNTYFAELFEYDPAAAYGPGKVPARSKVWSLRPAW